MREEALGSVTAGEEALDGGRCRGDTGGLAGSREASGTGTGVAGMWLELSSEVGGSLAQKPPHQRGGGRAVGGGALL